jgi:hypothetical protein
MTQGGATSGDQDAPKKTGLNLDLLFKPATAVLTSVGTLYLYGLRTSDLSAMESLPDDEPIARIRAFLPHVASLVEAKGFKDERPPLPTEDVDRLSDAELEHLAEVYAAIRIASRLACGASALHPERS